LEAKLGQLRTTSQDIVNKMNVPQAQTSDKMVRERRAYSDVASIELPFFFARMKRMMHLLFHLKMMFFDGLRK
jgi:hypothetical protein